MKALKKTGVVALIPILVVMVLFAAQSALPQCEGSFPSSPGNEETNSMGKFRIAIAEDFQDLFAVNGWYTPDFYDVDSKRLESPVIFDNNTVILVSAPHDHGSDVDLNTGTQVGELDSPEVIYPAFNVTDEDIGPAPPGFQGGPGTREIHTEIYRFLMEYGPLTLRVGRGYNVDPPSYGEVESKDGDMYPELEGESFFNIFVEVELEGLDGSGEVATLENREPLLVMAPDSVCHLPPNVIYVHGNSSAVPIYFTNSNSWGNWNEGDLLGHLVLSGHGVGVDESTFQAAWGEMDAAGEMPISDKIPTLTEWGMIIFCALLFAWMAWMVVRRRRATEVGI